MTADRKRSRSSFIARLLGAAAFGGALLVVPGAPGFDAAAATNPGMTPAPAPPPAKGSSDKGDKAKSGEDHHDNPDPNWDVLEGLGGLNVGGPGRRPNMPAHATGAGTAGDEAAANDAVAAAAAARAAKPKSNSDMPDAIRAERCENNRRRIAELERQLAQIKLAEGSLHAAEERSSQLYDDLPASSAEYVLVRADVKSLKAIVAPGPDLRSQLAWHKNNLVALGCV